MAPLPSIRRWLASPRELERGVLMRRTGIALNLAGAIYALAYAAVFATPAGTVRTAICGLILGAVGLALFALPPRPHYATLSALLATGLIGVILWTPDPTISVPLFYLWPMLALAYFHSPQFLAGSLLWMVITLIPGALIDGDASTYVMAIGAISATVMMSALVSVIRRDERQLRDFLVSSSTTDALTGLLNRRAFVPAYEQVITEARERGNGATVVLIDLDHFKRFNDTHGHLAGDAALRRVAAALRAGTEPGDLVARLGGEEFAVVLLGRGAAAAQRYCDRVAAAIGPELTEVPSDPLTRAGIRAGLQAQLSAVAGAEPDPIAPLQESVPPAAEPAPEARERELPPITSSFGIVHTSPSDATTPDALLGHADAALYAAKRSGRDRTAIWSDGRSVLGAPMHVGGRLSVGACEPFDISSESEAPAGPSASALLRRRTTVLFRAAAAMFVAGGLNAYVAAALLDMTDDARRLQWIIGSGLIVVGVGLAVVRGSLRHVPWIGCLGIVIVSTVVATADPLTTAPFFYVWPVAMVAYFAPPRTAAWVYAWAGVTLMVALSITNQPVDKVGLLVGTLLNLAMLTGLIASLRWREDRLSEGLEAAAAIDPLTGTLTRRAFLPIVDAWLAPGGSPGVAFVLVDVDHFKRFNDEHGHLAGDDALRSAAAALQAAAPEGAQVCRFGGEEFAIALPAGGMTAARSCADRIAEELADRGGALTISAGIAVARPGERVLDRLVARADQGLYAAKGAGRARVAWFAADSDEELVVSEPIRVARPAAFAVIDGAEDGPVDLSSAA